MASATVAVDSGCDLGESPVWDERTSTLYFVDINAKRVHVFRPADGSHRTLQLAEPVGCVALTSDPGRLLAALQHDVVLLNAESGQVERVLATVPESHGRESMRFNDGKVSPQGTLVVGRMHAKWREGQRGRLYRLDPGSAQLAEAMTPEEVLLPNGLDWDQKKGVVYLIDSGAESVVAYETDAQGTMRRGGDGRLLGRTVSRAPTRYKHVPDGMCLDAEGNVWVALAESGSLVCYDAESGKELRRVPLPVQRPTSCAFGGPGLETLYVTTRVEAGERVSPHHGALLAVTVPGVRGLTAAHPFPLE